MLAKLSLVRPADFWPLTKLFRSALNERFNVLNIMMLLLPL